jgi:hypothetical protein
MFHLFHLVIIDVYIGTVDHITIQEFDIAVSRIVAVCDILIFSILLV